MRDYIEAADLPHDEKVYLKKDWLGWRVVEPPKTFWSYIFGSKRNLVQLILFFIFLALLYYGVADLISSYETIAASPCDFCNDNSFFINPNL